MAIDKFDEAIEMTYWNHHASHCDECGLKEESNGLGRWYIRFPVGRETSYLAIFCGACFAKGITRMYTGVEREA